MRASFRAFIGAFVAVLVTGCGQRQVHYTTNFLMALDISNQKKAPLDLVGKIGYEAERRAASDEQVKIYLFAHTFEVAYNAAPIKSKAKFNLDVGNRLNKPSVAMHIPDTRTEVMISEFASLPISSPTEIILVTDGGIEGLTPSVIGSIKASLKTLAANGNVVRFLVLGVHQEHRKQWELWVSTFGPTRGRVYGTNDYTEGLQFVGRFGR